MRDPAATPLQSQLELFSAEVLRWNERFSLISRVEPEVRLPLLLDECRAAWDAYFGPETPIGAPGSLLYLDLGTGGGFPGLVWHLLFEACSRSDFARTLCFEPRDKRAWFLDHCARQIGSDRFFVTATPWNAKTPSAESLGFDLGVIERVVISMKALRLTDEEVLAAWRRFAGPESSVQLEILRFVGEGFELDDSTVKDLLLPPAVHSPGLPGSKVQSFAAGDQPYGLLISQYPPRND